MEANNDAGYGTRAKKHAEEAAEAAERFRAAHTAAVKQHAKKERTEARQEAELEERRGAAHRAEAAFVAATKKAAEANQKEEEARARAEQQNLPPQRTPRWWKVALSA